MEIEEIMIDYYTNKATRSEQEDFFGHVSNLGIVTREMCEDNLAQMPDEELIKFLNKFGHTMDEDGCYSINQCHHVPTSDVTIMR